MVKMGRQSQGNNRGRRDPVGRPKGRTTTENTTLRLDPAMKAQVAAAAKEEDRSISSMLRQMIKEALAAREKRKSKR